MTTFTNLEQSYIPFENISDFVIIDDNIELKYDFISVQNYKKSPQNPNVHLNMVKEIFGHILRTQNQEIVFFHVSTEQPNIPYINFMFKYILDYSEIFIIAPEKFYLSEKYLLTDYFLNFDNIILNYAIEPLPYVWNGPSCRIKYGYKMPKCIKYKIFTNFTRKDDPDFINYKRNQKLNELYE
jgi:hypothetical protein